METVGAAVVAECANQYGDLQDEVGDLGKKTNRTFLLYHWIPDAGSIDDIATG